MNRLVTSDRNRVGARVGETYETGNVTDAVATAERGLLGQHNFVTTFFAHRSQAGYTMVGFSQGNVVISRAESQRNGGCVS